MAATPTGRGYWLVASDGGIFSFGDAAFHGSTGGDPPEPADRRHGRHARRARATGSVAADGGIFSFGDAGFFGSPAAPTPQRPAPLQAVGLAPSPTGRGYQIATADGAVFPFGDAPFLGSASGAPLALPIVGIAR